jgi:hypothetical protein
MKNCFVMQPFDGGVFDKRYSDVFSPAIIDAGLVPYRVDQDPGASIPIQSIEEGIRNSLICLADISIDNPNVWFELGYALSAGKQVVLVCSSERTSKFPFDIQHRAIIKYKSESSSDFENLKKAVTQKLKAYINQKDQTPKPSEIIDYSTSRKGHFELAAKLLRSGCKRLFLMQRSSSLILGAEQGWGGEKAFHEALMNSIASGVEFVHVISIDGIISHLKRPESYFPDIESSLSNLKVQRGHVAVSGPTNDWYIKKIPTARHDPLLKPDRQARTLIAEFDDGSVEGLLVTDLGGQQGWFSMKGPKVKKFMNACYEFYHSCEHVLDSDLQKIKQTATNEKRTP